MSVPGFWLWQAAAAVCGAGALWLVASGLQRLLHIPRASRGYWLGVWLLAVLPMPMAIGTQRLAPLALSAPPPLPAELGRMSAALAQVQADLPSAESTAWLGPLLLLIYAVGAGVAIWRWCAGARALAALLRGARAPGPRDLLGPRSRSECERLRQGGVRVMLVDAPVSPFAIQWPQATIALPRALVARLDDRQLQLVLRHEAAHLARRDPFWALLMRMAGVLLWFNPFLTAIVRRVRLAAELACDAAALGGDATARKRYAAAYLETLRLCAASGTHTAAAHAFSTRDPGAHRMRMHHMMHGDPCARRRPWLAVALGVAALPVGAALGCVHAATSELQQVAFTAPIVAGRLASAYGPAGPQHRQRMHQGIDLAAARGTAVHAPAAAVVAVATTTYAEGPDYGSVIVLDHGGGWQTLYAHLDQIDVRVGEQVAAGQRIGRVGTTGRSTGPHVHVEVRHRGERVDPASVLASPLAP